jgi:hypothetical protein
MNIIGAEIQVEGIVPFAANKGKGTVHIYTGELVFLGPYDIPPAQLGTSFTQAMV